MRRTGKTVRATQPCQLHSISQTKNIRRAWNCSHADSNRHLDIAMRAILAVFCCFVWVSGSPGWSKRTAVKQHESGKYQSHHHHHRSAHRLIDYHRVEGGLERYSNTRLGRLGILERRLDLVSARLSNVLVWAVVRCCLTA